MVRGYFGEFFYAHHPSLLPICVQTLAALSKSPAGSIFAIAHIVLLKFTRSLSA